MFFKLCLGALKGQISSSLRGLVLVPELAAQEEGSDGGSRAVLPKDVKPHLSTHALWAEVLAGLVGFMAVCSSSSHILYQGAARRPKGMFYLSALQTEDFFPHLLLFFSQIATEFLMFICTLADWEICWCAVRWAYHILPSSTSLSLPCHLAFETSM